MKYPLVSIGMPVYNGEKLIRRALESILSQDYPRIEIIISENCSEDDTYKICSEYKERFPNFKMVIIRQNVTIPVMDNFIAALEPAAGKYFMWAAVDDSWDPSFVSKLVAELEGNDKYAVAQSATMKVSTSDFKEIGYVRFDGKKNPEKCSMLQLTKKIVSPLKYNYYIYGLFRRELLVQAFRHMPRIPSSDRWFLLQFPLAGYGFGYIDEPLYIRTMADEPLYIRYPKEELGVQLKRIQNKWFWFGALPVVKKMLSDSDMVPNKKITNYIVLMQIFFAKAKPPNLLLMLRLMFIDLLPKKTVLRIREKRRRERMRKNEKK